MNYICKDLKIDLRKNLTKMHILDKEEISNLLNLRRSWLIDFNNKIIMPDEFQVKLRNTIKQQILEFRSFI
jgi:hypothetical protein